MYPTAMGQGRRGLNALFAALVATALIAVALVTAVSSLASAQVATSTGDADDTAGVFLYSAGLDSGQGFLTPPASDCVGTPGADPTNETVQIAVDASPPALYFLGDEDIEVTAFNLGDGASGERFGGTADAATSDVVTGLSSINDYGTVANGTDDDANYDAETGGDVTLQLHVGGAPAFIFADGVVSTGVLAADPGAPFANLDGGEIFIFEDAELSGYTVELYGAEGLSGAPYSLAVDDFQRNPDTSTGADDTLLAIDLDSLPGFSFPYVSFVKIIDDNTPVDPPGVVCPGTVTAAQGDTSLEIDAVATRTDVVSVEVPSIDIEKTTNGDQADTGAGLDIPVGDPVVWEYTVTNTGSLDLIDVVVTDNRPVTIDCGDGTATIGDLAAGASTSCLANGTAEEGAYTNIGTVTGQPLGPTGEPLGGPIDDEDPSAYTGVIPAAPSVDIEKATDGVDSDAAPGETLTVGDAVTWTYVVENTGNVVLTDVAVTDDLVAVVTCPSGNPIPSLAPAATETCTATGTVVEGAYTNTATVSGNPPAGAPPVSDTDPSNYTGVIPPAPSVDVEKATDGVDSDAAPGETLTVGDAVTWTYVVENTGNVVLTDVAVTDDLVAVVTCPSGNPIPSLAPAATETCTATGTVIEGAYTNTASVSGTPPGGLPPVGDTDPSNYTGVVPLASLGDYVFFDTNRNGIQDDGETGVPGATVTLWTATADGAPEAVVAGVAPITTGADGAYLFTDLAPNVAYIVQFQVPPGHAFTTTLAGTDTTIDSDATAAGLTAPVTLAPGENNPTIDAGVYALVPGVELEKTTNGAQADDGVGETLVVGETVTWVYTVTNTGELALADLVITDDLEGEICTIASLAIDATDTCTKTGVATAGDYSNEGSVTGQPVDPDGNPVGPTVDDTDPSGYVALALASIGDFIFVDSDRDGLQTGEAGFPNATVNLWSVNADGSPNAVIETVTTGADGAYLFDDLAPNVAYIVQVVLPAGYKFTQADAGEDETIDSDANLDGLIPAVTPDPGEAILTLDAGVVALATIGDYVWEDTNLNGIQDDDEDGKAGVTVNLWSVADGVPTELDSTVTGLTGFYQFTGLDPALSYQIQIVPPADSVVTLADQGDDDEKDSDIGLAGTTPVVTLAPGQTNLSLDAGIVPKAAVGDFVWFDANSNGIQDDGEPGIEGVSVSLWNTDADGAPVEPKVTVETDADGMYLFSDVDPFKVYVVQVVKDAPYSFTAAGAGDDTAVDSNVVDLANGITGLIDLTTGTDLTIDAGLLPLVAEIEIVKTTSGANFTAGETVTWTYVVTNTGQVGLDDVSVVDNIEGDICTIPSLAIGESETCTKTGVAIAGNYVNTATSTGTPDTPNPDGSDVTPPTDTDTSDYEGTEVQRRVVTPTPTPRPAPTSTPVPTATPVPPTPTPAPVVPLAVTGASSGSLALTAAGMLLLGAALVALGRRRQLQLVSGQSPVA